MAKNTFEYFIVSFPKEYVAVVEINRPDRLNAFHKPMWLELKVIFDHLSIDPSVRVILLTAAGLKAFSAGLDIQAASQGILHTDGDSRDGARIATVLRRHVIEFQDCISSVEACEKPVICILHGHTIGLAIDLCTCADIRLCTSTTRFAVKEVDIGLAADIGTLSRLPKVVGGTTSWVKDICLTARPFGADEALRHGLVSAVYDSKDLALQHGLAMAQLLATKSPVAVQGTKHLLNYSRDHSVADGLRYTAVWNSAAVQTSDVQRALEAGALKRVPRFEKL